jgi:hypothetical protein
MTAIGVSVVGLIVLVGGASAETSKPGSGMQQDISGLVSTNTRQHEMRLGYWIALIAGIVAVASALGVRRHWRILAPTGALCSFAAVLIVAYGWPAFSPSRYAGIPTDAYPQKPWPWPYVNAARIASEHSSDPARMREALGKFKGGAFSAVRVFDVVASNGTTIDNLTEISDSDPPILYVADSSPVHLFVKASPGARYDIQVEVARTDDQALDDVEAARRQADTCPAGNLFFYARRLKNVFAAIGYCGATRKRLAPEIKVIDRLMAGLPR